jgi:hypothetical protein
MKLPQISLRELFVLVSAIAVGIAALLNANEWWVSLLWAAVLLLLVFAGFVAFFRREAQRAFWCGYLAAGSLYLLLLMYSVPQVSQTNSWVPYGPLNNSKLITTKVLFWAYSLLPAAKTTPSLPSSPPQSGFGGSGSGSGGSRMGGKGGGRVRAVPNPTYVDQEAFVEVGQALWMLLFSWLGGRLALGLFRTRSTSDNAAST